MKDGIETTPKVNIKDEPRKPYGFLTKAEFEELQKTGKLVAVCFRLPNIKINGKSIVKELEVSVFSSEYEDKALLHKLLERTRTPES